MITAIIVDKSQADCKALSRLLKQLVMPVRVLSVCTTVSGAVNAIKKNKPELVFLDITNGAAETGFKLLEQFKKPDFSVIFTGKNKDADNIIKAIRIRAWDFLPKPIVPAELANAFTRFSESRRPVMHAPKGKNAESVWIATLDGKIRIELNNVVYCVSTNSYTDFHLHKNTGKASVYKSSMSIKEWERVLAHSDICRIHNRFLVNLMYVDKYIARGNGAMLTLKNGIELPVSRSKRENLKRKLKIYYGSK